MADLSDERIDSLCRMSVTATEMHLAEEVRRHRATMAKLTAHVDTLADIRDELDGQVEDEADSCRRADLIGMREVMSQVVDAIRGDR